VLTNFPSEPKDGDDDKHDDHDSDKDNASGDDVGQEADTERVSTQPKPFVSRGTLVRQFVEGSATAAEYAKSVVKRDNEFDGFNLLLWDGVGPVACVHSPWLLLLLLPLLLLPLLLLLLLLQHKYGFIYAVARSPLGPHPSGTLRTVATAAVARESSALACMGWRTPSCCAHPSGTRCAARYTPRCVCECVCVCVQ